MDLSKELGAPFSLVPGAALLFGFAFALPLRAQGLMGGGGFAPAIDGPSPLERELVERSIARHAFWSGPLAFQSLAPTPEKFTFYPLAGTLYGDLFTYNFVDLDPTNGILDWGCTRITYDGHDASDVTLRSFGEQEIGVPVFAALDGIVLYAHDGEDDMHTSCDGLANAVSIQHAAGRFCSYLHLKKGSVGVKVGEIVKAGQQIGLAGSSGCSTYPHLHFATYDWGTLVEPYAGPCRPGESEWTDQAPIERLLYVGDMNVTDVNISQYPGLPFDMPRTGTFVQGSRPVRFWATLSNLPGTSRYRVQILRPDTSIALDSGSRRFGNHLARWSWWWWSYTLDLDQLGTWAIALQVDGTEVARAPFDVVGSGDRIVNRPPDSIEVALEPLVPTYDDVLVCRVNTDLVLDDPDYDIVRYRYVWSINGKTERDVTTAAHSDVFPRRTARPGSLVACTVTPSDGIDSGEPATSAVLIH